MNIEEVLGRTVGGFTFMARCAVCGEAVEDMADVRHHNRFSQLQMGATEFVKDLVGQKMPILVARRYIENFPGWRAVYHGCWGPVEISGFRVGSDHKWGLTVSPAVIRPGLNDLFHATNVAEQAEKWYSSCRLIAPQLTALGYTWAIIMSYGKDDPQLGEEWMEALNSAFPSINLPDGLNLSDLKEP